MEMYETTLDFVSDEDYLLMYTSDKKYRGRLRRLADDHPDEVTVKVDDGMVLGVKMPVSWFRFPLPPKKRAPMSEERKEQARERMKELRAAGKLKH